MGRGGVVRHATMAGEVNTLIDNATSPRLSDDAGSTPAHAPYNSRRRWCNVPLNKRGKHKIRPCEDGTARLRAQKQGKRS
jgi:hypothetical protein